MNLEETMAALKNLGCERTKRTLLKHGAKEPFWGVKIGDMKKLAKETGADHELALKLFATGNSDAMYFASIIVDPSRLTKATLRNWAKNAHWYYLSEYAVAQTAAESKHAWPLGHEWINSTKESIATTGWSTLANFISITPDDQLELEEISSLVNRVENSIHESSNRVKYTMCGFLTCIGSYITSLHQAALDSAKRIGRVTITTPTPGCSTPDIERDIKKVKARNRIGKKRKQARC